MSNKVRTGDVKLNGKKAGTIRLLMPDPSQRIVGDGWRRLEDRLSSRAMTLPRLRRAIERKGVSGTELLPDGTYGIWTGEHADRFARILRRIKATGKAKQPDIGPVPKGYRSLGRR